jgi:two-component system sensor histidine kinase and response regulator WspE
MAGPGDSADPALLELFRAELDTHLPVLGEGLLSLEKDRNQPRLFEAMMRAAHSIKGAARIVGVGPAEKIAHVMEDCFVAAQKGEVSLGPGAIDVLLRGVDFLGQVGRPPDNGGDSKEEFLEELAEAIAAVKKGGPGPKAEEAGPRAPPPPTMAVLRPENLDWEGGDRLRRELLARVQNGFRHIQLDLSAVRDVDPASLALLALLPRTPNPEGSPLRLEVVGLTTEVRQLLRLTRLDRAFSLAAEGGR